MARTTWTVDGLNALDQVASRLQIASAARGIYSESFTRQASAGSVSIMVDGTAYFMSIGLRAGDVVTNIITCIGTSGTAVTLSKVGLYSKSGLQLAASADQGTAWQTTGIKVVAMATPYTVPADDGYFVCLVSKASTTLPSPFRGHTSAVLSAAVTGFMGDLGTQTGQTDLPSPATIAVGSGSPISYWVGIS